jgi:cytoskeleton protein RodZ
MSEQSMPDQEATEVNYSFGQRLSSARRALNLTQEQVAAELRLNAGLIKALEEEDYSSLPPHLYIAGYLRNYARLLKIPVEPLLSALDKTRLESPPLITDASRPRKASHNKLIVKLFALVLLIVVIAGIVSWIQSQDFALFSGKQSGVEDTGQTEQKALSAPLPEKVDEEPPVNESDAPETETGPETLVVPVVPVVEEVAKTEAGATEEVTTRTGQPETGNDGVELLLSFSDDCWVEVKDSRGEKLLYGLFHNGQREQVTGMPPFSIFVGNAAAVAIEYNGQPYDTSAHVRGNLARFQLGRTDDDKSN